MKFEEERHQRAVRRSWALNAALVRCAMAHEAATGPAAADAAAAVATAEAALDDLVRDT